jgi:hypothetical protein
MPRIHAILSLALLFPLISCVASPTTPETLKPDSTQDVEYFLEIDSNPRGAEVVCVHPETKAEQVIGNTPLRIRCLSATLATYDGMARAGLPTPVCTKLTTGAPYCTYDRKTLAWKESQFLVVVNQWRTCQVQVLSSARYSLVVRDRAGSTRAKSLVVEIPLAPPTDERVLKRFVDLTTP